MNQVQNIVILGSTGSVGCQALEVVEHHPDRFRLVGLASGKGGERLRQQVQKYQPLRVAVSDPDALEDLKSSPECSGCELIEGGLDSIDRMVSDDRVDRVVQAIAGGPGLRSTVAALKAGKIVALANKESLVLGGEWLMALASASGGRILPVDSEHSAVFQVLEGLPIEEVRRIILTASGGPFLDLPLARFPEVTAEEALAHPTWNMGPKITIDSATMLNKAIEVIEARWLFGVPLEKIEVVVHPQSIVHSMVEMVDGSIFAQMGNPDMRVPVQWALSYPHRWVSPATYFDFSSNHRLEFFPPDLSRFPALALGYRVAREGGSSGAAFISASELAVEKFLAGEISFEQIALLVEGALDRHETIFDPNLQQILEVDRQVRQEMTSCSF
ncbi:MAG: 1-deoxy-D-xylulose-5-phosphate reductoisomerase [Planctomycetota bacterium]|jgi:1-deoxy-D-xylulose-5-phosphate reductoisomerase|nr:1-deoxy-D-xylulose-5-phosphate reductoisomerase [Planctomycetota bacterium]